MRYIIFISFLFASFVALSDEITIKTVTENGKTTFFLNAGSFSKPENAQQLKESLAKKVSVPVHIKFQEDKKLYLVQLGPLNDYNKARETKEKLSAKTPPVQLASNILPKPQILAQTETDAAPANQEAPAEEQPGEALPEPPQPTDALPDPVETPPQPLTEAAPAAPPAPVAPTPQPAQPVQPAVRANTSEKLWNIRNGDIRAVIAEVSRVTGKNFVIDPRVQGKISIVSSKPMNNNALYEVFLSVLQVSGYAAIPTGNIIKIIPNVDAKTLSPNSMGQMFNPSIGDEMVVHVVPVHYVPAEQLVPVLRPLMPQWSNVSAYAPSNMLILSGRSNNIKRLAEIIHQVDSSSTNGIDMVPLKYSLAMDVVPTLKELIKGATSAAGGGGGGGGGGSSSIMIAADDRSNSILLSGSKTERIRIRMLIAKLDTGSTGSQNSTTQVVYLHYMRAEDMVPILAGVAQANFSGNVGTIFGTITEPVLDSSNPLSALSNAPSSGAGEGNVALTPPAKPAGTAGAAGAANTSQVTTENEGNTKPSVQIIAEPNTNSVIINAPASVIRILKSVIRQLDIKPAQILVEAMVVEINETDIKSLGIEWGSIDSEGAFSPGFAIINTATRLSQFQAEIFALIDKQKANVLSTPSVVVLDNRQAKILVGQQVSIQSTSFATNAVSAAPFTTFNRQNVTLHLYVRPQLTRGNGIQMQIDQGNDTLDPATATSENPIINVSSIVTSVHVDSGDVVVLGGLMRDSVGNNDKNVAVVSEIPGLGRLFQHDIRRREKRVLLVFIKPVILRNEKDLSFVSDSKYNDTRQYQLDYARSLDYDPTNTNPVMPSLSQPVLPRPFNRPIEPAIVKPAPAPAVVMGTR